MPERPRGPIIWTPTTPRQKAILGDVLERYDELNELDQLPRGPRGCFYDLRPEGYGRGVTYLKRTIDPATGRLRPFSETRMEADVATVSEIVVLARRAGLIPEDWVDDERAPDPIIPLEFRDAEEATNWIESILSDFRLERQTGQDRFVEIWAEAAGITGRLAAIAAPLGVPVYSGGGFDGLKGKRAAAERAAFRDVPTIALHVGDYDKHGRWVFKALAEDAVAWVPFYAELFGTWSGPWTFEHAPERHLLWDDDGTAVLDVIRLGVTEQQVADGLVELDDKGKAEAEQLPADWQILTDALNGLLDPARWERVIAREPAERDRLRTLLTERWSGTPEGDDA